jgi:ethanolaminephosphotransferase
MSSTASNYDVPKLFAGQVFTSSATLLAFVAAGPTFAGSIKTSGPFLGISLLYGIMLFASSYVEEEQHFWYWATTAWLTLLWIKGYASISYVAQETES